MILFHYCSSNVFVESPSQKKKTEKQKKEVEVASEWMGDSREISNPTPLKPSKIDSTGNELKKRPPHTSAAKKLEKPTRRRSTMHARQAQRPASKAQSSAAANNNIAAACARSTSRSSRQRACSTST